MLSQDWQRRLMYSFPPLTLLSNVIQKLKTTQEGEMIRIAPLLPSQSTTFVTNNLNNSYDISDLVWLNQIMDKLWLPTLYEMDSHSPSPDLSHVLFFPSQLDLFRHVSAREENCLVKLQPSLEFACYNCSDSLLYDSECFWIYLEYIFVEYCPTAA